MVVIQWIRRESAGGVAMKNKANLQRSVKCEVGSWRAGPAGTKQSQSTDIGRTAGDTPWLQYAIGPALSPTGGAGCTNKANWASREAIAVRVCTNKPKRRWSVVETKPISGRKDLFDPRKRGTPNDSGARARRVMHPQRAAA